MADLPEHAVNGVLLMAYGSPERPEDLEAYYTDIRRGRPPTPEQLADLRARYDAIGGLSPLAARTRAQVDALQLVLDAQPDRGQFRVELGLKHASPSIEDGMHALLDAGIRDITLIVLAPHHSVLSVGQYFERAEAVAEMTDDHIRVGGPLCWGTHPGLIDLLDDRVALACKAMEGGLPELILFTAHSLPVRALELDDPTYPDQLRATAQGVAGTLQLPAGHFRIAWQSAGRTPEPWIGPDILDVIRGLPAEGITSVLVCPAGFTSDHLEVLYDIDIEAKRVAAEAGVRLARTESLNDDPRFIDVLADLVFDEQAVTRSEGRAGGA